MPMHTKLSLEDGIQLAQIWQTLNRNRWLFGLTFVGFMIAGYILWCVLPPTYQARAQINIGRVSSTGFIEAPSTGFIEQPGNLAARLMIEYGPIKDNHGQVIDKSIPALMIARLHKGATAIVELVVEGGERSATQAFLESITKRVLENHQQIYDRNAAALTAQLQALDNHQQALEKAYTEVSLFIDQNPNALKADSVHFALLSIQRGQLGQLLINLDMRRPIIIANLNMPYAYPTVLMKEIDALDRPAAPRRALIMAVAFILGMIFGVLAAFCRDAVRAARAGQPAV